MKFVLLIHRTAPPEVTVPGDVDRAALVAHRALQTEASARGDLLAVARLGDAREGRVVRRVGASHDVTDGPFVETKEWLVGFYLVDCEDEAIALERARTICGDEYHVIEVRPVTWTRVS